MKEELLELRASEFFKVLGDYTRFKIVYCLINSEKNVSEIVKSVNATQTAVSYQLKLLRASHLVKYRRDGQNIYYSIDDEHISTIVTTAMKHLKEEGNYGL